MLSDILIIFSEKVKFRSQILVSPSIGEYWNTFGVPVLPENVIFTFFRMCWCYSEAYNTGTQKWFSIVQYSCTSIWDFKYTFSIFSSSHTLHLIYLSPFSSHSLYDLLFLHISFTSLIWTLLLQKSGGCFSPHQPRCSAGPGQCSKKLSVQYNDLHSFCHICFWHRNEYSSYIFCRNSRNLLTESYLKESLFSQFEKL